MLKRAQNLHQDKRGQNLLEYALILGVLVTVLVAMGTYMQRGLQGMVKTVADQIGTQENAEQIFNTDSGGLLTGSYTSVAGSTNKKTRDTIGNIVYTFDDATLVYTNQLIDIGFTDDPPP